MGAETWIVVWLGLGSVIGGNGFAAGVAAFLHGAGHSSRGARVAASAIAAGMLPASLIVAIGLTQEGRAEQPLVWAVAFFAVLAIVTVLSLPGAIVVSKRLDRPSSEHRVFE